MVSLCLMHIAATRAVLKSPANIDVSRPKSSVGPDSLHIMIALYLSTGN